MKKSLTFIFLSSTLLLASCQSNNSNDSTIVNEETYEVRFLANIPDVNVSLSSSIVTNGNNILYTTIQVKENEAILKPDEDPKRNGYTFGGWYLDKEGTNSYDFSNKVSSNLTLYAKWERENVSIEDNFVEPIIPFQEIINNNIDDISLNGVLNSPIVDDNVYLTTIGIRKLEESKENIKELLNYSINENISIQSATYQDNKIYVTLSSNRSIEINVIDKTSSLAVSNTYYESKALNYEKKADIAPRSIVLAGSSSMENWTTSSEDLKPLTTINVGIGGTTVEQWNDCLAERLIYPFSPREVVLYVGINNIINSKKSGQETGDALISLFNNIHERLEDTQIFYVLMNLVPDYMNYKEEILKSNSIVMNYGEDKEYLHFINASTLLMKESGLPNRAYFLSDGLHMSLYGYVLWGGIVKESIIDFEKKKYQSN